MRREYMVWRGASRIEESGGGPQYYLVPRTTFTRTLSIPLFPAPSPRPKVISRISESRMAEAAQTTHTRTFSGVLMSPAQRSPKDYLSAGVRLVHAWHDEGAKSLVPRGVNGPQMACTLDGILTAGHISGHGHRLPSRSCEPIDYPWIRHALNVLFAVKFIQVDQVLTAGLSGLGPRERSRQIWLAYRSSARQYTFK